MKKIISLVLSIVLMLSTLFSVNVFAKVDLPTISKNKPLITYTYNSSGKVYAYKDAKLKNKTGGYIACATDECKIIEIKGDAVKVIYPVSNGTKTAWFSREAFTKRDLAKDGAKKITVSESSLPTYKWKGKTSKFGSISKGDKVYLLRGDEESEWLQVIYPVSGGYKMGWVKSEVTVENYSATIEHCGGDEYVSQSEISSIANKNKIKTNSNAYKALLSINTKYASKIKDKKGVNVFVFEGVGSSSKVNERLNAMCVVVNNGKITYLNLNSTTIPDQPFKPKFNGGTAVPTMISGIYDYTATNHNNEYAALHIQGKKAPVMRFSSKTKYEKSTSEKINVHQRYKNTIQTNSKYIPNSQGCLNIGKAGIGNTIDAKKANNPEYLEFIQAVGIVEKNAKSNSRVSEKGKSVKGQIVIDRVYAEQYLKDIGYPSAAIKKIIG